MTQKQTKQKGFTIVELLIVVVIIAILAAITIVAYNGIQARANASAAAMSANLVQKKAEAANAIKGIYPTSTGTASGGFAEQKDSDLAGSGVTLVATAPASTFKTNNVSYRICTTPASGQPASQAEIGYWDPQGSGSAKYVYLGGTAVGNCTTWAAYLSGTF